jgi:hypothetical protein
MRRAKSSQKSDAQTAETARFSFAYIGVSTVASASRCCADGDPLGAGGASGLRPAVTHTSFPRQFSFPEISGARSIPAIPRRALRTPLLPAAGIKSLSHRCRPQISDERAAWGSAKGTHATLFEAAAIALPGPLVNSSP